MFADEEAVSSITILATCYQLSYTFMDSTIGILNQKKLFAPSIVSVKVSSHGNKKYLKQEAIAFRLHLGNPK